MKGGRDAARLAHRTRYFATREGVQLLKDDNSSLPATKKQQQYIRRLLRSFPAASELPEHEDYVNMPSRQAAKPPLILSLKSMKILSNPWTAEKTIWTMLQIVLA